MMAGIRRAIGRSRLRDNRFASLFEPYQGDEAVCFDLETTGLDTTSCEILNIGAVKIRGNRILTSQKLNLIVQPAGSIDRAAIKTHRLRHVDVADGLQPIAALTQLLEFIGPRPLVGYYLEFDIAVVNRYILPWLGIRLANKQIDVSQQYYDWKTRGAVAGDVDLRFDALLKDLDLPALPKHSAINDAVMTALIHTKLAHPATANAPVCRNRRSDTDAASLLRV